MILNCSRMPGAGISRPLTHRIQFQVAPGERPVVDLFVEGDTEVVRSLLVDRLDMEPERASRVISALQGYGVAATELDIEAADARNFFKAYRAELREQSKPKPEPAPISQPAKIVV